MIGIPKIKSDSGGPSFDPLQNEQIRPPSETSKPALPKNETPSRFWAFVEPYCKDVTESDVKVIICVLNKVLKSRSGRNN